MYSSLRSNLDRSEPFQELHMNVFEQTSGASDLAIQNGVDTVVSPVIPDVFSKDKFTVLLLNTGTVPLTITYIDINGLRRSMKLANSGPGITKDFVPWDLIAGGIVAQGQGGAGLLFYDVYNTEARRESQSQILASYLPAIPVDEEQKPIPLLIKEYTL